MAAEHEAQYVPHQLGARRRRWRPAAIRRGNRPIDRPRTHPQSNLADVGYFAVGVEAYDVSQESELSAARVDNIGADVVGIRLKAAADAGALCVSQF
jgi:hypothetical protein